MTKFNPATFRYTPQIVSRRDAFGNSRTITLTYDNANACYVGTISSQDMHVRATATRDHRAADQAILQFNAQYC